MTEKVTGNSAWETTNMNDGMERHGEVGCWEAECCSKRISSGCCPRRCEQELDEILSGKITNDMLAEALNVELNSAMYNDGDTDEDIDEGTDDETYIYMSPDELKAFLDSGDSSYEIPFWAYGRIS